MPEIDFTRRRFLFGLAALPLAIPAAKHFIVKAPTLIGYAAPHPFPIGVGDGFSAHGYVHLSRPAIDDTTLRLIGVEIRRAARRSLLLTKFADPARID